MKKLLIVLTILILASCKKQPVKECWTVQGYKMVQVVPSVYQVTLTYKNQTKIIRQSVPPMVGSNTCDGNSIIEFRF